ncbi:MAG: hypothetical protein V3V75_00320, partial [Thermoguttaceae bacterium]
VRESNGRTEVVVHGNGGIVALDATDGSKLWWISGLPSLPIPSPVVGDGLVYAIAHFAGSASDEHVDMPKFDELLEAYDQDEDGTISQAELEAERVLYSRGDPEGRGDVTLGMIASMADRRGDRDSSLSRHEWGQVEQSRANVHKAEHAILAIRPGMEGDVTASNVVWKEKKALPEVPTALYYRGNLYAVKNGGIVSCLDGKSGRLQYRKRIGVGGMIYASPVAGDGKIYTAWLSGEVVVFDAGNSFNVLATNDLGEPIAATPAIVEGTLYIRTESHLYAFGK